MIYIFYFIFIFIILSLFGYYIQQKTKREFDLINILEFSIDNKYKELIKEEF